MNEGHRHLAMAVGLCFIATELAGLALTGVPVCRYFASDSLLRTVWIGVLVTGMPAAVFSVLLAFVTRWVRCRNRSAAISYGASFVITSVAFLACIPRFLYFNPPLIPDYSRVSAEHYFLWLSAIAAGFVGTAALGAYWRRRDAKDRPARRKAAQLGGVVIIATGFSLAMWLSGLLLPTQPAGWGRIHVGMDRDEALRWVGPAQTSGWPEKIVETWEVRGILCDRKLQIAYRGAGKYDGHVRALQEGVWLNGYGWLHRRTEQHEGE